MPFVFKCGRCGTIVYVDFSPELHKFKGSNRDSPFRYYEHLFWKIGNKCNTCGKSFSCPPLKIEVSQWKK